MLKQFCQTLMPTGHSVRTTRCLKLEKDNKSLNKVPAVLIGLHEFFLLFLQNVCHAVL